jgi:hypothetical protein
MGDGVTRQKAAMVVENGNGGRDVKADLASPRQWVPLHTSSFKTGLSCPSHTKNTSIACGARQLESW